MVPYRWCGVLFVAFAEATLLCVASFSSHPLPWWVDQKVVDCCALLCSFGFCLLPWRVNQRVVDHATRASPFLGVTLSTSVCCHGMLVERVRRPFFYLLLFSLLIPVDLVRCGLSPLVPTSLIRVNCHDMWIKVPWNQSPFSLVSVP